MCARCWGFLAHFGGVGALPLCGPALRVGAASAVRAGLSMQATEPAAAKQECLTWKNLARSLLRLSSTGLGDGSESGRVESSDMLEKRRFWRSRGKVKSSLHVLNGTPVEDVSNGAQFLCEHWAAVLRARPTNAAARRALAVCAALDGEPLPADWKLAQLVFLPNSPEGGGLVRLPVLFGRYRSSMRLPRPLLVRSTSRWLRRLGG